MFRFVVLGSVVGVAILSPAGCAPRPTARVSGVYAHDSRSLVRLDYDNDGDGRIDVRTYMRNARPARLEADRDADGRVDRWEYYSPTGVLLRIGGTTRGDGREDTWLRLDGNRRVVEFSTRRDGRTDRRETYEGDALLRTESDTNHDGLFDRWEEFRGGGVVRLMLDDERRHGRPTRQIVYGAAGDVRVDAIGAEEIDAAR